MKILLDKSNSSLEASELLKNEEHFASSVHCAYYSCIQLMRHVLFNCENEDEETFDNSDDLKGKGSHEYLKNKIVNILKNKNINTRDFSDNFRNIKSLRKNADYKQKVIFANDSNNAYNIALVLNKILKINYQL